MHPLLPSLLAAFLYVGGAIHQGLRLRERKTPDKRMLAVLGLLALISHATALFFQLIAPAGLTLDFFNAASLIAAAVTGLTLLACSRMPVENLLLLLYPLGALTVLLTIFVPSGTVQPIDEERKKERKKNEKARVRVRVNRRRMKEPDSEQIRRVKGQT